MRVQMTKVLFKEPHLVFPAMTSILWKDIYDLTVRIFKWLQLAKTKHHYNSLCILGFCILKLSSELSWLSCPMYERIYFHQRSSQYTHNVVILPQNHLAFSSYLHVCPIPRQERTFQKGQIQPPPTNTVPHCDRYNDQYNVFCCVTYCN